MPSALALAPGEKLRLGRGARRGNYTIGKGLEDLGAVRIQARGDVALTFHGVEHAIRPVDQGWHLALVADDGTQLATYAPDRKRRGVITAPDGDELVLDFPRRKDKRGQLFRGTQPVADVTVQNGVVLTTAHEPLDPLVVAFAATVTLLRGGYKEPEHAPRPQWQQSPGGWWSTGVLGLGLFATSSSYDAELYGGAGADGGSIDVSDFGGGGDFGGGDSGGGGGDGGGGGSN